MVAANSGLRLCTCPLRLWAWFQEPDAPPPPPRWTRRRAARFFKSRTPPPPPPRRTRRALFKSRTPPPPPPPPDAPPRRALFQEPDDAPRLFPPPAGRAAAPRASFTFYAGRNPNRAVRFIKSRTPSPPPLDAPPRRALLSLSMCVTLTLCVYSKIFFKIFFQKFLPIFFPKLRHTASTMISLVPGLGSRKFATQVVYLSLASLGLVAANSRLHASFNFLCA